jgi:hypothetical protein
VLRSVKHDLGLKVPGVYRIPCECGKVYVGQTGRSMETRCKEHRRHTRLDQPDKSAVAERSINTGHCIDHQQHHRYGQNVELYGSSFERGHWHQTEQQNLQSQIVRVTLRLTVSQSVSLGVEPPSGSMSRFYSYTMTNAIFVSLGRPL